MMAELQTASSLVSGTPPQQALLGLDMSQILDAGFMSLPNELLGRVLDELPMLDLVSCRELCRRLKHLVDTTSSCQYKLECALASVEPRPSSQYDYSSAVTRLRDWRTASVDFTMASQYDIPFVDGFSETIVNRSIMAQVIPDSNGLLITQLRSRSRGIPFKQWTLDNISTPLCIHEVDQGQDLLVIVDFIYSDGMLRSLSISSLSLTTGESHPDGPKEPLLVPLEVALHEPLQQSLSISDDHIAVMVYDDVSQLHSELWIWNWKTGERKLDIYGGLSGGSREIGSSSIFLAHENILLPLWIPIGRQQERLSLQTVVYNPGIPERTHYDDVPWSARFQLPQLVTHLEIVRMEAAGPSYTRRGFPDHLNVPFECNPQNRTLVINIALATEFLDRLQGYYLFIPADVIEQPCQVSLEYHGTPFIPWCDLSHYVRMVPKRPFGLIGNGQVFHTRCIFPDIDSDSLTGEEDDEEDEGPPLVIYEFASKLSLRHEQLLRGRTSSCSYVFEPTVIENREVWKDTIVTGALCPYRRIETSLRLRVQTGMYCITEDAVIMGEETGESWRVWSY